MNMLAYEANAAWNREITCILFKNLIQLYFLCSFLYSLTYCIKEVIKGNISWRLNGNSDDLWGSYGLKQGNPLRFFQNTDPIVFVLFIFWFWLTVSNTLSKTIFFDNKLKVLALEAATAWNRRIYSKILKLLEFLFFLSTDLLFYLMSKNGYQRKHILVLN